MSTIPQFPGLEGLMVLSRREGVDIRPTLLRVLTDLYVQTDRHTAEEARQYSELATRLFDEVDDATRAAVRARLSIYPHTPADVVAKLGLTPRPSATPPNPPSEHAAASDRPSSRPPTMAQTDASHISVMFERANSSDRALILQKLSNAPVRPAAQISAIRAENAIAALEAAAIRRDPQTFARELAEALVVPVQIATRIVGDAGGEPLACAAKALGMSGDAYQRVLLFLDPEVGTSVTRVYRLSRLYDHLDRRAALVMLAAWRGATVFAPSPRARLQSQLYDGERQRARTSAMRPGYNPAAAPGSADHSRRSGEG